MKEATGELNMTVVTVVAIAAVAAFFYAFVWPAIRENIQRNTHCANAICSESCANGVCNCTYIKEDGTAESIVCNSKNASEGATTTP